MQSPHFYDIFFVLQIIYLKKKKKATVKQIVFLMNNTIYAFIFSIPGTQF